MNVLYMGWSLDSRSAKFYGLKCLYFLMTRDGHGLPKVSPRPYHSTPCGRATNEKALRPFQEWPTRTGGGLLPPSTHLDTPFCTPMQGPGQAYTPYTKYRGPGLWGAWEDLIMKVIWGRTDGPTDGRTDQPTNIVSYRGACSHLKRIVLYKR
jgi:hypothetical protein